MANTDAPFGFKALRHKRGGEVRTNYYVIASDESSDIGIGDPVVRSGTASTTGNNAGVPIVTLATAGAADASNAPVTGIVAAFEPSRNDLTLNFYDASQISTEVGVWVYDDPGIVFTVQDDGTATLAVTDIGSNINIALDSGVDTATGRSGAELDASNVATTSTHQCRLLRLHKDGGDNNEVGTFAIWEVLINHHTEDSNLAGV